jgi:predicted dehydrogenase
MDNRWKLVAGCFSRDPDINQASAETWGVEQHRVHPDIASLINAEAGSIDAVVVLTPTPSHFEHISTLLDAGYNVISEKALATTSTEASLLHRRASDGGLFLRVTMNYTGYPMVRELRRMILDGQLGTIQSVQIEMPQEGFLRRGADGLARTPQAWRQNDAGPIPTVALDLGTHAHHLLFFLLGSGPVRVVGTQTHHGLVSDVVDYVSCLAKMQNGADINLWFGKSMLGSRNGLAIRIYGDDASAQWVQKNPEEVLWATPDGQVTVLDRASPGIKEASDTRYERFKAGHPAGFVEAFANLYTDLAEDLISFRNGARSGPFTAGADHASEGLRMLEALAESSESGAWCEIPA